MQSRAEIIRAEYTQLMSQAITQRNQRDYPHAKQNFTQAKEQLLSIKEEFTEQDWIKLADCQIGLATCMTGFDAKQHYEDAISSLEHVADKMNPDYLFKQGFAMYHLGIEERCGISKMQKVKFLQHAITVFNKLPISQGTSSFIRACHYELFKFYNDIGDLKSARASWHAYLQLILDSKDQQVDFDESSISYGYLLLKGLCEKTLLKHQPLTILYGAAYDAFNQSEPSTCYVSEKDMKSKNYRLTDFLKKMHAVLNSEISHPFLKYDLLLFLRLIKSVANRAGHMKTWAKQLMEDEYINDFITTQLEQAEKSNKPDKLVQLSANHPSIQVDMATRLAELQEAVCQLSEEIAQIRTALPASQPVVSSLAAHGLFPPAVDTDRSKNNITVARLS